MINAAIFILTHNTEVRRVYLKTCLYFLFKHFNEKYKYPVVIFHEGDYDEKSQREILTSVRSSCRSCVSFRAVDHEDFEVPDYIDKKKLTDSVNLKLVPYWRNEKYRLMCNWWINHMPRYASAYDYVMRVDDDSIIEEPIPDLFEWFSKKDLVYASNILHIDCALCSYGMKEFLLENYEDKKEVIEKMFIKREVPLKSVLLHPFRELISMTYDKLPDLGDKETMTLWSPLMYYNNFFITKTSFWQKEEVKEFIDKVNKNGSVFYWRWGDAPIQSFIVTMFAESNKVSRASFKYSKRMQRESFQDGNGEVYSYMPETYDKSSCITEK